MGVRAPLSAEQEKMKLKFNQLWDGWEGENT